jgi:hypothetical protein
MNRLEAKYLRTEKFSNKNFFIEIKLYEGGLARGRCECKRCAVEEKMWKSNGSPLLYFPSYHWITIMEWREFYNCFTTDKTARRWVRRVMQHSFKGLLRPNGEIDHDRFEMEHDRSLSRSREYYCLNAEQLLTMKRCLPGFFYPGTFRTECDRCYSDVLRISSKEKYKNFSPPAHPVGYRKYLNGNLRMPFKRYFPIEVLKAFLQEFDPKFYAQVCEERTIDDCNMWVEYHFLKGEKPEMRIFVQDNNYIDYYLPGD